MNYRHLQEMDPEVFQAVADEVERQRAHIELIASENFVSPAVLEAMGSPLTNKYAEGYPGRRYYGGCQYVDVAENIARDRAKELFHAEHANVQPHSGAQANTAVYFAMLQPGDVVLGMNLSHGGHLTHGSPVNLSGKYFHFVPYGLNPETERLDYEEVRRLAREHRPKMIVAGASAYPREIDFRKMAEIAHEAGALLMVDMAHIAGLVAAGLHQSPVPYADFVTTTTHKTLRGPRGGMILCKEAYAKAIDKAIFPGTQGGPLMHVIAAKAVCFGEALKPEFRQYQQQIIRNAKALENALRRLDVRMVSDGTDNHLLLLDLTNTSRTGKELEELLGRDDKANVTQLSVRMELKVNVAASLKHFNRGAPRSAPLFSAVLAVRQREGKRIFLQYDLSAGNTAAAATASILDLVVQTAFEQVGGRVILALDEMPQLGPCFRETLAKASSVGRSYHLDIIAGVQSLAQMTEVYTETSAKALMNNFQTQLHFSTGDPDSEEYLRRQVGNILVERSRLVPGLGLRRGAMEMTSALTEETLGTMNVGDCVVLQTGAKPCLVHFEH